jgi:arylformamidase
MVANTGTYLDAPSHRFADGRDLSELDLLSLAHRDAIVIDVTDSAMRGISRSRFEGMRLQGKAVLVRTGWDAY